MRIFFALATATLITLAAATSHAGYTNGDSASCTRNSDGSGWCSGTFAGFRKSPGPYDFVVFTSYYNFGVFAADLNNVYYSCTFPNDNSLAPLLNNAMSASTEYFYIAWNAAGICQPSSQIGRGSYFGQ